MRFCVVLTFTFLATIVVKSLKHIITFIVGDADQSHRPVELLYSLVKENDGIQNVWASSPVPMTRTYISSIQIFFSSIKTASSPPAATPYPLPQQSVNVTDTAKSVLYTRMTRPSTRFATILKQQSGFMIYFRIVCAALIISDVKFV